MTKTLNISTSKRQEFIDITAKVEQALSKAKIDTGFCVIFCPHTTAALTINENADPSVRRDIIEHLQSLVPYNKGYAHSEGNSDAHIKASLMGFSLNVIIESGSLQLGTWQGIYFCEFDGPRQRQVYLSFIKGEV